MEKEKFFGGPPPHLNWQQSSEVPVLEMNGGGSSSDQLPPCFLNLNWDRSLDPTVQFESAFSSIVSSPSGPAPPATESIVIRELIGRLGSICNSGEISPQSHHHHHYISAGNNSNNNSSYNTPLNSPPKLNLSIMDRRHPRAGGNFQISGNTAAPPATHLAQFAPDPGFAERAARFSCFSGPNYGGLSGEFVVQESGELSRVSSSQSLKGGGSQLGVSQNKDIPLQEGSQLEMEIRANQFSNRISGSSTLEDAEFGSLREESSSSDQIAAGGEVALRGPGESNGRKRKATTRAKAKDLLPSYPSARDPLKMVVDDDLNAKRSKSAESGGTDMEDEVIPKVDQKHGKENNSKPPEPPKQDFIHVRARRGQATDSHSLAERVRREKISERMKFLQDLVPGCNKVTGKAVMLDEIINYVQSLQRQVEFLSMKLATVNPRLDLLQKDMHQSRGPLPHSIYPLENSALAFPFTHQPQQGTALQSMSLSVDGFGVDASQMGTFWEDDLQSVVQMGFGQNQELTFSSQIFHGALPTNHMKVEL